MAQSVHKRVVICVHLLYLWFCQTSDIRFEVVNNPLARSWKGDAAHQEHEQHDVREGGCQIHHLSDTPPGCGHSSGVGEKPFAHTESEFYEIKIKKTTNILTNELDAEFKTTFSAF